MKRQTLTATLAALTIVVASRSAFAGFETKSDVLSYATYMAAPTDWAGWVWVAVLATAAVGGVLLTGGTASPALTAAGSWIGSLAGYSGAAATSYGFAVLGGGSIASGGGGIAVGTVVLSSIFAIGSEVGGHAVKLTIKEVREQQVVRAPVPGLPYPTDAGGDIRLQQSIDLIKTAFAFGDHMPTLPPAYGPQTFRVALAMLDIKVAGYRSTEQFARLHTARAILRYNLKEFSEAALDAQRAVSAARGFASLNRVKLAAPEDVLAVLAQAKRDKVKLGAPIVVWLLARAAEDALPGDKAVAIFSAVVEEERSHDWLPLVAYPLVDLLGRKSSRSSVETLVSVHKAMTSKLTQDDDLRAQIESVTALRSLVALEEVRRESARHLCSEGTPEQTPLRETASTILTQAQNAFDLAQSSIQFLKTHHRGVLWDGEKYAVAVRMDRQRKTYGTFFGALAKLTGERRYEQDRKKFCGLVVKS